MVPINAVAFNKKLKSGSLEGVTGVGTVTI